MNYRWHLQAIERRWRYTVEGMRRLVETFTQHSCSDGHHFDFDTVHPHWYIWKRQPKSRRVGV